MAIHGQSLVDFETHYVACTSEVFRFYQYCRYFAEKSPVTGHNDYTAATIMCLLILSGSRAISGFLHALTHQIHHDLNLVFPMDKDVSDAHFSRIVVMPSCVADMLIAYAMHLNNLVNELNRMGKHETTSKFQTLLDKNVSFAQTPIDYFSYLQPNFTIRPFKRDDVSMALGPMWPLRIQETRGQYIRYMCEENAPVFQVRLQAGHDTILSPSFGYRNQYTVYEFRRDFIEYADRYASAVGALK